MSPAAAQPPAGLPCAVDAVAEVVTSIGVSTDHVRRVVDAFPPLTSAQRDSIAALLFGRATATAA